MEDWKKQHEQNKAEWALHDGDIEYWKKQHEQNKIQLEIIKQRIADREKEFSALREEDIQHDEATRLEFWKWLSTELAVVAKELRDLRTDIENKNASK